MLEYPCGVMEKIVKSLHHFSGEETSLDVQAA
jgi:hypothetical protein